MVLNQPTDTDRYLQQAGFTGLNSDKPDTPGNAEAQLPDPNNAEPLMPNSTEVRAGQDVEAVLRNFRLPDDL